MVDLSTQLSEVRHFTFSVVFPPSPLGPSNFIGQVCGEVGEGFMDVDKLVATGSCGTVCWPHHHWLWPLVPLIWSETQVVSSPDVPATDGRGPCMCGMSHGLQAFSRRPRCSAPMLLSLWRQCCCAVFCPTSRLVCGSGVQSLRWQARLFPHHF